ncbi:hypothetical protein A7U60_g7100 [Sanghuangporus baumii]|uniref:Uncharacterized protein n=1 Tax=Sanghuangporus baumii TaxID=108892 RepID=A0A9Q5N0Y3_SANBA|nr:hypothetical protein A7U60_g7100 [Sanghuangporus baumii]
MTDLVIVVALALQAAGEGVNQGSKALKKVHVAKPRDFDGKHNYVDFKRELCLYIYASESEFRTNKNSWDTFLKKLDTSFNDPARSQKAFEQLDVMYQGDLNADEFFNKFNICRVDTGLATEAHDEWLMSCLKRALNPKVVEGIMRLPNEPTLYEEFKKAAVKVGHYIRECPRGREAIRAIIAAFVSEDREALLEELGQAKESSFEEVDVRAVPTELEELVEGEGLFSLDSLKYNRPAVQYQDVNISDGFTLQKILTNVLPDESKDDDNDFEVYEDLFVRRTEVQAGKLKEEEQIQTTIKNEVVVEEPYCENVVAQANITEAVWDVVGRCAAEVWHEGIEDAEQFVRRAGGKELDAFISIVHPKVTGDNEVDLLNPRLEDEHFIDAHTLIDSGCTGSCIDEGFVKRYGNEGGLIKEYIMVRMFFGKHEEEIQLAVMSLASSNIFLGHDWLQKHNPEIDWKIGSVKFT